MIDESELEWEINTYIHKTTVEALDSFCKYLEDMGYDVGGSWRTCNVSITWEGHGLNLSLNEIIDADMPAVLLAMREKGIEVTSLAHRALNQCFTLHNAMFEPDILEDFWQACITYGAPLDAWEDWKARSGFREWVQEVYENDD